MLSLSLLSSSVNVTFPLHVCLSALSLSLPVSAEQIQVQVLIIFRDFACFAG